MVLSASLGYLDDAFLDDLLASATLTWGPQVRSGPPSVVVSLVVLWTWFNSGLIEVSLRLGELSQGDVSPTRPKESRACRSHARPFGDPFMVDVMNLKMGGPRCVCMGPGDALQLAPPIPPLGPPPPVPHGTAGCRRGFQGSGLYGGFEGGTRVPQTRPQGSYTG